MTSEEVESVGVDNRNVRQRLEDRGPKAERFLRIRRYLLAIQRQGNTGQSTGRPGGNAPKPSLCGKKPLCL